MLKVLQAGFFTSIQDKGRVGLASIGVPVSGVMDSFSADLANNILNNTAEDAVLEITLGVCKFQFLEPTIICISGGDFSPNLNGKSIRLNKRIQVDSNTILSFGKVNYGVRCYLAVKGGFLSENKLGSRSFCQNITSSSRVHKQDLISYNKFNFDISTAKSSIKTHKNHFDSQKIGCFKGPEFHLLNKHQQEKIRFTTFSISKDNNRMGYKLNEIIANTLPQILTSAVLPGTVQLTPSGKLIVLMRDCQVTGGYPRILQLTEASIDKLAQKTKDATFQFLLSDF